MLGLVLCAFFALGVMTGFSAVGRVAALRIAHLLSSLGIRNVLASLMSISTGDGPLHDLAARLGIGLSSGSRGHPFPGDAVAMVERRDGFYALVGDGELRGPISPAAEGDLPILSGPGVDGARAGEFMEFAALMVRAEAQLSHLVSEMNVDEDRTASLYLDGSRTQIVIDIDRSGVEIRRAAEILAQWGEREQMISGIDMTTPGEAILRLTPLPGSKSGTGAAMASNGRRTEPQPKVTVASADSTQRRSSSISGVAARISHTHTGVARGRVDSRRKVP